MFRGGWEVQPDCCDNTCLCIGLEEEVVEIKVSHLSN